MVHRWKIPTMAACDGGPYTEQILKLIKKNKEQRDFALEFIVRKEIRDICDQYIVDLWWRVVHKCVQEERQLRKELKDYLNI